MDSLSAISQSRISIPKRHTDLLYRPRIKELIDEVIEKKLVIISAPAGYGKTSVMVEYASRTNIPVCWYSIDQLDQNPHTFLLYFIKAIKQKFPNFGDRSISLLTESNQINDLDYIVPVIRDLYDNVNEHFIIVLDDFQLVNEIISIRSFINKFLREMDENTHVVILSRTLLSLPVLPILVAKSDVGGISYAELAFQKNEVIDLFQKNQGVALSDKEVEELINQTEGWITGIVLAEHLNVITDISRARLKRVTGVGLDDYFLHIIDGMDNELRRFLLWSSLIEEFNADLCENVFTKIYSQKPGKWKEWITELQKNNFFIYSVGKNGDWIRYHPLFLDFLQSRVQLEFPVETQEIYQSYAAICENNRDWSKAYSIYQRLGDRSKTVSLLLRAGSDILTEGRVSLLSSWLDKVNGDELQQFPYLMTMKGYISLLIGDKKQALSYYARALSLLDKEHDLEYIARTLIHKSNAERLSGNINLALADAQYCISILDKSNLNTSMTGEAYRCIGLCKFHLGKYADAIHWLKKAKTAVAVQNDNKSEAVVSMEIGLVLEQQGNFSDAAKWYQLSLEYWEKVDNPYWLANLYNNLGVLNQLKGEYRAGLLNFEKALEYSKKSGYLRMEAYVRTGISDIYYDLQNYEEAEKGYKEGYSLAVSVQEFFLQVYIQVQLATISSYMGRASEGYKYIQNARENLNISGSDRDKHLCDLGFSEVSIIDGKDEEVLTLLEECYNYFQSEGQKIQASRALTLQLIVNLRMQQFDLTVSKIINLLTMIENEDLLFGLAPLLARWLDKVDKTGLEILDEQIEEIRTRCGEYQLRLQEFNNNSQPVSDIGNHEAKLAIRALGKMQVFIDEKIVDNSAWQTQAAKNLFFLLLAHPEGMTKEEISLYFWPDASPEEVKYRFKNTIYRVRKALGKSCLLLEQDYYRFNNKLNYQYDIELFLEALACAGREADADNKYAYLLKAVNVYCGEYLPDIEDDWVMGYRELLKQNYISTLLQISEILLNKLDYAEALFYCKKAISEDNLLEDSYRLALNIYSAMGNRAGIVRIYKACVAVLEREISTQPSRQTTDLYLKLIK